MPTCQPWPLVEFARTCVTSLSEWLVVLRNASDQRHSHALSVLFDSAVRPYAPPLPRRPQPARDHHHSRVPLDATRSRARITCPPFLVAV
jgi:hypothetical protein